MLYFFCDCLCYSLVVSLCIVFMYLLLLVVLTLIRRISNTFSYIVSYFELF